MAAVRHISTILLTSFLVIGIVNAASKIAVATKVNGKVQFERGENPGYKDLKPGAVLEDGDRIKTGATGFAAIIFIDDKSTLKIKGNTKVEITGKRSAASISKKINLDAGTLRAKVSKLRKGTFIVQTPTSVASVKGTDFWLISDPVTGDLLFSIEGVINFTNILSGISLDILAGLTGNSTPDGNMDSTPTNPSDIPDDPDDTGAGVSELRIFLVDPNGVEKTIVIQYQ